MNLKKHWNHLEWKIGYCILELLNGSPSHHVHHDVLQAGTDVVIDWRNNGICANKGATQYARSSSEAQQDQWCSWKKYENQSWSSQQKLFVDV